LTTVSVKWPLILASASPRRRELLGMAGIPLEVFPSQVDEKNIPGESPVEHVLRVAGAKAQEVSRSHPDRWVLAADTVVVIDDRVLGKPRDPRDAEAMLTALSNREHQVLTAYSILNGSSLQKREGVVITRVLFKALSAEEIRWYIRSGEPFDKAGGYAVQGRGAFMIREVYGSYTNVVGLPLCEVLEALRELDEVQPVG
jgi:septum formation protein